MTQQNTQRGLSYDPAVAKRQREAQQVVAEARIKERNKAERAEALRAHGRELDRQAREARKAKRQKPEAGRALGRRLDQIEQCYREYTPVQIHSCAEMVGESVDDQFDAGLIEWKDDCLAIVGS